MLPNFHYIAAKSKIIAMGTDEIRWNAVELSFSTGHLEQNRVLLPVSCILPHMLPLCENWDPENRCRCWSCSRLLLAVVVLRWSYAELVFGTVVRWEVCIEPHNLGLSQLTAVCIPCLTWPLTSMFTSVSTLWVLLCSCCTHTMQVNDAAPWVWQWQIWPLHFFVQYGQF